MARRLIRSVGLISMAIALMLAPSVGSAAVLVGDVTAVLTVLPTPPGAEIFNGTVTVGSGPQLLGSALLADWFLEVTATGFVLAASCPDVPTNACDFTFDAEGLRLSLSSLDFSPAAALVGLTPVGGDLIDQGATIDTLVTASSVVIDFKAFFVGSGATEDTMYEALFQAVVPHPGTALLLGLGALAAGALALRRTRG